MNAPEPKANNLTMRNDNLSLPVLVGPFKNKTSFQGNSRQQLKIIIDQPSAKVFPFKMYISWVELIDGV